MLFVRNLKTPTVATSLQNHAVCIYANEIFRLAGYTFVSELGAAWSSCVVTNRGAGIGTGFDVSALSPRIVYDPLGSFTQNHVDKEMSIFLYATNNQNRSGYRITRFIDVNNVEIDADGAPPNGWITEQGMAGRVINTQVATLASADWHLLRAPACNLQFRIYKLSTATCRFFVRPLGGAGTATEIPAAGTDLLFSVSATYSRLNADMDGKNVVFYGFENATNTYNDVLVIGELTDTAVLDTDPGFIMGTASASTVAPWLYPMYMLNGAGVPAQIAAYPIQIKQYPTESNADTHLAQRNWLLQNGRPGLVSLRKPGVVLDNVLNIGGFGRGRLPLIRFANVYLERWRPIEAAGSWLHTINGLVVPRNGPNDQRVLVPYV